MQLAKHDTTAVPPTNNNRTISCVEEHGADLEDFAAVLPLLL